MVSVAAASTRSVARFQHVHFYLRRPAASWLQPVCQPGEHMALAGRSRAGLAPKNAPRFAISAEQFRVTAENVEQCKRKQTAPRRPPNMNTTSKTETASISKISTPQKSSVIEITRTSNLHAPPMARSACRSMPRHLSSSPNE
jgi:hypothetical protein